MRKKRRPAPQRDASTKRKMATRATSIAVVHVRSARSGKVAAPIRIAQARTARPARACFRSARTKRKTETRRMSTAAATAALPARATTNASRTTTARRTCAPSARVVHAQNLRTAERTSVSLTAARRALAARRQSLRPRFPRPLATPLFATAPATPPPKSTTPMSHPTRIFTIAKRRAVTTGRSVVSRRRVSCHRPTATNVTPSRAAERHRPFRGNRNIRHAAAAIAMAATTACNVCPRPIASASTTDWSVKTTRACRVAQRVHIAPLENCARSRAQVGFAERVASPGSAKAVTRVMTGGSTRPAAERTRPMVFRIASIALPTRHFQERFASLFTITLDFADAMWRLTADFFRIALPSCRRRSPTIATRRLTARTTDSVVRLASSRGQLPLYATTVSGKANARRRHVGETKHVFRGAARQQNAQQNAREARNITALDAPPIAIFVRLRHCTPR